MLQITKKNNLILALVIIFLIVIVGITDYYTGEKIDICVFYIIPLFIATWTMGLITGLIVCFFCVVAMLITNVLLVQYEISMWIVYWNEAIRTAFFLILIFLLARLKNILGHEKRMARVDFLTQTANKRSFYEFIQYEIDRSQRYHYPISFIYMDIDNFKDINDRFGHIVGDNFLKAVAKMIKNNIRTNDIVARLGGDEFGILLPETNTKQLRIVSQKIYKLLLAQRKRTFKFVTFSLGGVTCQGANCSINELIKQADKLMYSVKKNMKNKIALGSMK